MNIAICDTQRKDRDLLIAMLNHYATINQLHINIFEFTSEKEIENMNSLHYSIVFLEANWTSWNSLEIAKNIKNNNPEIVLVFLSDETTFAPMGYKVQAYRYLLIEELNSNFPEWLDDIILKAKEKNMTEYIKLNGKYHKINLASIVYIESYKHSILFHFLDGTKLEYYDRISKWENKIFDKGFLRIQKGYLVNMRYIVKITNYYAVLDNGMKLKCSEKNYRIIQEKFFQWNME